MLSSTHVRVLRARALSAKPTTLCSRPLYTNFRALSSTAAAAPAETAAAAPAPIPHDGKKIYEGPLTRTFRRLKVLSISSLFATTAISPFFFIVESHLPTVARISLAAIAVTTSAVSTGLVSYCTRPYVTRMSKFKTPAGGYELEITNLTIFLNPRITKIYDTDFLVDTQRPMAKWELPFRVLLPASRKDEIPAPGTEETVAETFSKDGELLGSWVVKWGNNGDGECRALGSVDRYFNVHLELLQRKADAEQAAQAEPPVA